MKEQFIQYDDEYNDILYSKCELVKDINSQHIQNIIKEMQTKMRAIGGLGLAANQIGYPYQIFMIEFDKKNTSRYTINLPDVPFQVFINPTINKHSNQNVSFWHGCLSAIGYKRAKLATYKEIEYQAYDQYGEIIKGSLSNLAAVIFQHEFAHLLGKMYIDFDTQYIDNDVLTEMINSKKINIYEDCDHSVPHIISDYQIGSSI
ncbi:peptide deformylase [Francisella adeliensis]|uniref:Peptide deformylase n=1 Tax=Francisella adeliensis TaxID=2007306 RepID=A0A2Z4XXK2_9GAMM|nr:peptide deformylase [Francisella adeliensis]AXA33544.1 peptide deformylase [Francisella adeliensis]MBK2084751.1 peptide deformylase [Francisella adeliensis]MBK2097306.1 peptide deformylase [Francisella adeliensis]QIW11776.1 peptide deformylase [Francisella adeliensis]QIW13652.1 peptide deformylase [Francisella adeliensis]